MLPFESMVVFVYNHIETDIYLGKNLEKAQPSDRNNVNF